MNCSWAVQPDRRDRSPSASSRSSVIDRSISARFTQSLIRGPDRSAWTSNKFWVSAPDSGERLQLRRSEMSHNTGTVQVLGAPLVVGPGPTTHFNPPAAPGGTKLLILHFQNLDFKPGDKLQVNLGYEIDEFTAADGPFFWTRPINVYAFPAGVEITYIPAGPLTGSVQLDK